MGKLRKKLVKAFTLVELIVVMAIIAILAGVSIGSYIGITNKAKKTAALAEANQIRTQLYAIASENGGFKSGPLSGHSISFPDDINYFTAELLAASSLKKASGSTAYNPYIAFNFYSDEYKTPVDSSISNYVRLAIGYLIAANNGNINTETVNKYANEVYVDTTDGTISTFDVVKDGTWATAYVNSEATSFSRTTTPTISTVAVSPTTTEDSTLESGATWTNWYANDNYTRFQTRLSAVNPSKNDNDSVPATTAFMKTATFRIGTDNSVNLAPHVEAIANGSPISLSKLNKGAAHESITCKYYLSTDLKNEMSATDKATYFDATVDPAALGDIKLNAAAAGKSFVLTFQYGTGTNSSFPNVSYAFDAVEGYNINDVYDLFALNNETSYDGLEGGESTSARNTAIATYLTSNHKTPHINYKGGIFQKDIILKSSNIPSCFIWQAGEHGTYTYKDSEGTSHSVDWAVDPAVVGSLKDESYLVLHRHSAEHPTFDVYGNYFKLSLSADFPKIASDSFPPSNWSDPTGQLPANGATVQSHAAIFSDKAQQYLNVNAQAQTLYTNGLYKTFMTSFHDLASTGNHGVSNIADTAHAGVSFYKAFRNATMDDCLINSYYIPVMNNGQYVPVNDGDGTVTNKGVAPIINISSSRLIDSGNAALFVSKEGTINVTDSEVKRAGGPLAILAEKRYSLTEKTEAKATYAADNKDPRNGGWINIISSSIENWVAGSGGWFKINGVEGSFDQVKQFDPLFNALNKSFIKKIGSNKDINLIAITMGDKDSAADGGYFGGVRVNGASYIEYENGRSAMENSGMPAALSVAPTSDYGCMYLAENCNLKSTPIFKTVKVGVDAENNPTYNNYYGCFTTPTPTSISNTTAFIGGSATIDSNFGISDYLTMYYSGQLPIKGAYNQGAGAGNFASYAGSDAYGILMALNDLA
ncbi:MAG: type II secretion system GspH family protein [Bacilli bacterium]|nr:type II secretion system GspH family protein [Bacilli bacterium]